MREVVQRILEISINAPSGSNSQPWRFRVRGSQIEIIALPEKDHPILNYRNRGTWVAHGALIENIIIAALGMGYNTEVKIFPDINQPNLTAILSLKEGAVKGQDLFDAIPLRATNRKEYQNRLFTDEQKINFLNSASVIDDVRILFTDDLMKRSLMAKAIAINEIVTLENQELHKLFFNEIVWTSKEESIRKGGLYLKTMELKSPQRVALKLLRHWSIMKFFKSIGFARFIAKDNAKVYASGAGMGIIVIRDEDNAFISAGRAVERLWLKAEQMELAFHLMTGTMFFWQGINLGKSTMFSDKHVQLVNDGYDSIKRAFNVRQGVVALAFRVGYDGQPTARSAKLLPVVEYI